MNQIAVRENRARWLFLLLEAQLMLLIFTLPVGRIGGAALGLPFSLGGNTYKLFTPFVLTWALWFCLTPRRQPDRPQLFSSLGRFGAPALLFLIAGALAGAGKPGSYESLKWLMKYGLCLLFYLSLIHVPWRRETVIRCATTFVAGNLYLGLTVAYQIFFQDAYRAEGTFGHPNLLGAYLVLAIPLLLLIASRVSQPGLRAAVYSIAVLLFIAGGLTLSRAAYLGMFSALAVLWLAGRRHTLKQILPLLAVGAVIWIAHGKTIESRWLEIGTDLQGEHPNSRLRIWNETFDAVIDGMPAVGVGTAENFQDRWWGARLTQTALTPVPRFNHAHNVPLHFLATFGLSGLLILAWFTIAVVRAVPPWSPEGVWGESREGAYLLAGAVGFGLFGLVDMVLFTKNVSATAVLYLGLIDLMVPRRGSAGSAWERIVGDSAPEPEPQDAAAVTPTLSTTGPELRAVALPDPLADTLTGPPLKVLHLYANYRYTGPAENVLTLAALTQKRGHEVRLACPPHAPRVRLSSKGISIRRGESGGQSVLVERAQEMGIPLEERLLLNRHINLRDNIHDIGVLRALLGADEYDVVHVHQSHDHSLALLAGALCTRRCAVVVSQYRSGLGQAGGLRRRLLENGCELLLLLSERDRQEAQTVLKLDASRTAVMPGFVDPERFHPGLDGSALRTELGIEAEAPLFGVVARFQPYRRHDLVVRAWTEVKARHPRARLALIGRGEYQNEIERLVADLGLQDEVLFAGYHQDDRFPQAVAALDALIYLCPGSDGTCRAVLQAMSCGVAPVVAPVDVLPALVTSGESGWVLESSSPDAIAKSVCQLCEDSSLMPRLGEAARERVLQRHTAESVAVRLETAYRYAIQRMTGQPGNAL